MDSDSDSDGADSETDEKACWCSFEAGDDKALRIKADSLPYDKHHDMYHSEAL